MVSTLTGMVVQPNKAIVGANAFAHESGIHQDGVLKHQSTYEIMKPEMVGLGSNVMVLGKHSGRHAFTNYLKELGYTNLTEQQIQQAFDRFKKLADTKKTVHKQDIHAILSDQLYRTVDEIYKLKSVQVFAGSKATATATVCITKDGTEIHDAAIGDGPVDAIFKSISRLVNEKNQVMDYEVKAVTSGSDALGEVTVRIAAQNGAATSARPENSSEEKVVTWAGHGVDADILLASAKAYLSAINRMVSEPERNISKIQAPI